MNNLNKRRYGYINFAIKSCEFWINATMEDIKDGHRKLIKMDIDQAKELLDYAKEILKRIKNDKETDQIE